MPREIIELDPLTHITVDAIGKPGERVFFLQASSAERSITLLVEKVQIQTLNLAVRRFLEEIKASYPALTDASDAYDEKDMHITPPVDPLFRVGEMTLAYDVDRDMMSLIVREILSGEMQPEDAAEVRLWGTRSQMLAMCAWGETLAARGRPICPQCGQPMEPEGHFCPKKNGHKH